MFGLPTPWFLLGAVLSAIGLAVGGYSYGHRTAATSCERDKAVTAASYAKSLAEFTTAARTKEYEASIAASKIGAAYEKGKSDAQATADAVVAGLRTDNLRLRDRWKGCPAPGVPATASAAGRPDAAADDRSQSAGRIIGYAAACDAQIIGLQDFVREITR